MTIELDWNDDDDIEHRVELDVSYSTNGERDPQYQDDDFRIYSASIDGVQVPVERIERLMYENEAFEERVYEAAHREWKNECAR